MDPSAVAMRAEGQGLAAEAVLRRYLPEGMALPPGMVVGHANLSATLQVSGRCYHPCLACWPFYGSKRGGSTVGSSLIGLAAACRSSA